MPVFGSEIPGDQSNDDTIIHCKFALFTRNVKPQSTRFYFPALYSEGFIVSFLRLT